MIDDTPRDGDAEHIIEIVFSNRPDAELAYQFIEDLLGNVESDATLSLYSLNGSPDPHAAALREAEARGYKRAIEDAASRILDCRPQLSGPEYGLASIDERKAMRRSHRLYQRLAEMVRAFADQLQTEKGGGQHKEIESNCLRSTDNAQPPSVEGGGETTRKPLLGPECMTPDGGNVCLGFQILKEAWLADKDRADRILSALENPREELVKNIGEQFAYVTEPLRSGALDEISRDILRALAEHLRRTI